MNKSTKIWLNYTLGAVISALLLWGIYIQVNKQLDRVGPDAWTQTGDNIFLWLCLLLMPVNVLLEAKKWHILASSAQPLSYRKALSSMLAGVAFSIITPNRLGEYPGRIVYLKSKNTFRLISVSILGAAAQMLTLFIFGLAGLIYYNVQFDDVLGIIALAACVITTILLALLYWRFERWLPSLMRYKWIRKLHIYSQLVRRFTVKEQLTVLGISMLRFAIYTAQYLILLQWTNVPLPLADGFMMSALFFWVIAVIPSIVLVELGERGQVSMYLFHHFSDNTVGILAATIGVWAINLIIPAIIGSLLLIRMRWLK